MILQDKAMYKKKNQVVYHSLVQKLPTVVTEKASFQFKVLAVKWCAAAVGKITHLAKRTSS